VEEGHIASISLRLSRRAYSEELIEAWRSFRGRDPVRRLPSAPAAPIEYLEEAQAPQPRRHLRHGDGMVTSIGGLKRCALLDWKFTVLGHNTIRGAAGASILNAEYCAAEALAGC
jgi:aspartate-semialdehyde dehydrogenase